MQAKPETEHTFLSTAVHSRKWTSVAVFVLCLLLAGCTDTESALPETPELPPVPSIDVEHLGDEIRLEFTSVQDKLKETPLDGHYNARFARLLHAHLLHAPAAVMYKRCRLLRPSDLECLYLEALTQRLLGDNETATELLLTLLERKPNFPRASVVLADTYRQQGLTDLATPLFERAVRTNRDDLEAAYGLAMALYESGDATRATDLLNQLHSDGRNFGIVHAALATIYRQQGKPEEAAFSTAAASRFASSKIPFNDSVLWAVQDQQLGDQRIIREARALFAKGALREAADAYVRATVANPENADSHISLISLYGQLGHVAGAQRHFKKARELNATDVVSLVAMGNVHMKRGAFADARKLFAEAVEIRPSHSEARTLRTYCSQLLGERIEPDELRRALNDDPTQSLAHYLLGRHLASEQNCSDALPHLTSSIRLESAQTPAYVPELVRCLMQTGNVESAREQLGKGTALAQHYGNQNAGLALDQVAAQFPSLRSVDSTGDGGR